MHFQGEGGALSETIVMVIYITGTERTYVNCPKASNCTHLLKKIVQNQASCFFHDKGQYYFIDFYHERNMKLGFVLFFLKGVYS